jgi:trehalose 6-phosphate synthase
MTSSAFKRRPIWPTFQRYVIENCDGVLEANDRITAFGRTIRAQGRSPIGIDVDAFTEMAEAPHASEVIRQMQRRSVPVTQIIGIDRLDYSKGLPERFRAFQMLLEGLSRESQPGDR